MVVLAGYDIEAGGVLGDDNEMNWLRLRLPFILSSKLYLPATMRKRPTCAFLGRSLRISWNLRFQPTQPGTGQVPGNARTLKFERNLCWTLTTLKVVSVFVHCVLTCKDLKDAPVRAHRNESNADKVLASR